MANGTRKPMRQGQQNRRGRGRGRNKSQNPLSRNYESNGPDVKIRGTAAHVAEKYASLARDALSSGDTVAGESYLQHAEHYNRIIMANQVQQPESLNGSGAEQSRSASPSEAMDGKKADVKQADVKQADGKQIDGKKSDAASTGNVSDGSTSDEGLLRTLSRAAKSNGSAAEGDDKSKTDNAGETDEAPEKSTAGETPDEAVT